MTNKPWFQVLKGIGFILLLTLFWLLFFAATDQNPDPNNLDYEPFNGASFVLALPTYLIILFFIQYQKVVNLKAEIGSSFNAIAIKASHMENLVCQLREVTDRIVDHELKMSVKSTFSELIEEEKTSDHQTSDSNQAHHQHNKKKSNNQSGSAGSHDHISQVSDKVTKLVERLERDTDGRADQSLNQLMAEIKEAQAILTNQRLYHNETVANYNRAIYALPLAFFRQSFGFQEQDYA